MFLYHFLYGNIKYSSAASAYNEKNAIWKNFLTLICVFECWIMKQCDAEVPLPS